MCRCTLVGMLALVSTLDAAAWHVDAAKVAAPVVLLRQFLIPGSPHSGILSIFIPQAGPAFVFPAPSPHFLGTWQQTLINE